MRLSPLALLPLAGLVASSPLPPRNNDGNSTGVLKPETYAAIQALFNASEIPGAILAITTPDKDEVLPIGIKNKARDPVDKDTHWAIASNSKLITAVTINLLIEQNLTLENGQPFGLDSKLVDFVPDFQLWNESASAEISVVDLLSHYTGIPGTNAAVNVSWTATDWVENLRYIRNNIPPHTIFQYSNINFAIATRVVEVVTGRSFYDISKELIFDPLGLDATWDPREVEDKSQGFLKTGLNWTACAADSPQTLEEIAAATELPRSCLGQSEAIAFWTNGSGQEWAGGGAAVLSGNDMLKWMKAILYPDVIPASVVERVQAPVYYIKEDKTSGAGLGTFYVNYRGHNLSLHDGALPGSNSLFVRAPDDLFGFFVAVNDDTYGSTLNQQLQVLILDDLLGLEPVAAGNSTDSGAGSTDSSSNAAAASGNQTEPDPYTSAAGVPTAPIPADPRPVPDLSGTYSNPAYSDFTISPFNLSDQAAVEAAGFPLNHLLSDVGTVLGIDYLSRPVWHGTWGQMFANHIFFSAFDGPLINYTSLLVYDRVPGEVEIQQVPVNGSQYVAKLTLYGPAVYDETDGGIGFFGDFWVQNGDLPYPEVVEEGVDAASEVFFYKQ